MPRAARQSGNELPQSKLMAIVELRDSRQLDAVSADASFRGAKGDNWMRAKLALLGKLFLPRQIGNHCGRLPTLALGFNELEFGLS